MTFVGLHIAKCAGMSFLEMAQEKLPSDEIFQSTAMITNWETNRPEFLDIPDHRRLRLVWGHFIHEEMLHYLQNPILFTGMREPVARLRSHAKYVKRIQKLQNQPDTDIQAWASSQRNPMCWYIITRFPSLSGPPGLSPFNRARKALEAFHYIYFVENFSTSVRILFGALGIDADIKETNVGEREEIELPLNPDNLREDIALYDWARRTYGDKVLDPAMPTPEPLKSFLARKPDTPTLEKFLFQAQAREFSNWHVLQDVIAERQARIARLQRELKYYRA